MNSQDNLREAGEDYLEAILALENDNGEARSIDVANLLNVSRPSVNKAVGVLKDAGMVNQEPYGAIRLTPLGRSRAEEVSERHRVLKEFLSTVLGVTENVAEEDACRIEHIISEETMTKLVRYLRK